MVRDEDLLREATALVERAELRVHRFDDPVFIGFRRDRAGSVFFGDDPVYHFNADCQLRRAYRGGLLLKSEEGRLVGLQRRRTKTATELIRHDLSPPEQAEILDQARLQFDCLGAALHAGEFELLGQVPADDEQVLVRIVEWLDSLRGPINVARRPNV